MTAGRFEGRVVTYRRPDPHGRERRVLRHAIKPVMLSPVEVTDVRKIEEDGTRQYFQEHHVVRIAIEQTFWANDAQFPHALRSATRLIRQELYGDVLADLARIRLQLHQGDVEEATLMLLELERGLLG